MPEKASGRWSFLSLTKASRTQIHSRNPLARLTAEVKRCNDVVGTFRTRQP